MLISKEYRELNRKLHETDRTYGMGGGRYRDYVRRLWDTEGYASILDYGCGKGILKQLLEDLAVAEYDPAIPGKDANPAKSDLVVCTDVLEHIEPQLLNATLRHLASVTRRKLFFNIATRPAQRLLPDGRNTHLIQKPAEWWRDRMAEHFQITRWTAQEGSIHGEAFPIVGRVKSLAEQARTGRRRPLTPQWLTMFDAIRAQNAKYIDEFSRIKTIRMWEGVDDQPADMQVAVNILNDLRDIDLALTAIAKMANKAVLIHLVTTPDRTDKMWRAIFEQHFRIADWHVDEATGGLIMSGAPMVGVQGINAVGAVDTDERFEQVRRACQRIEKRFDPAPVHARRAIVACYGPSLKDNIEILRGEAQESGGAIISVSGSHDYLLSHGIVPTYHVECDPRPHKADNIAKPHAGVIYLLGSTCHEKVFDKLDGGDIRLWHVSTPEHCLRIVDELGEEGIHMVSGGGSVGLRSIPLLYGMGYRDFSIYGMDCSFAGDGSEQWAGPHAGKRQDLCECDCPDVKTGEMKRFITSPILLTYATNFFETVQKVSDLTIRLYGDGLLQSMALVYSNADKLALEAAA